MITQLSTSRDPQVSFSLMGPRKNIHCSILVQFSVRENLMVVTGNPETKELKDMMPEILKQVGPQQYNFLKTIMGNMDSVKEATNKQEEDEDDVPDLVGTNFEEASKQQ